MKRLHISGWNQFGNPISRSIPTPIPSLYFWLGRDAYEAPKYISKITIQEKPSPSSMQKLWKGGFRLQAKSRNG